MRPNINVDDLSRFLTHLLWCSLLCLRSHLVSTSQDTCDSFQVLLRTIWRLFQPLIPHFPFLPLFCLCREHNLSIILFPMVTMVQWIAEAFLPTMDLFSWVSLILDLSLLSYFLPVSCDNTTVWPSVISPHQAANIFHFLLTSKRWLHLVPPIILTCEYLCATSVRDAVSSYHA